MTNASYEPTIAKLQRLPEPLLPQVEAFIDFLQTRFDQAQQHASDPDPSRLAEAGMDAYRRNLEEYEDLLAAGKVTWQ